ncbi:MAG: DNA primase [Ruminococcus sp.]|nr:DNA primase [Ruminococcus sp.]
MIDFMAIKYSVSVPDAAEYYGINARHGMCCCIFHEEKHPSMKLYPKNYYCFGCGAHGDVIDLVQAVFNEKPVDAAKRINTDFGLGLDTGQPPDFERINRIRQQQLEREQFREWDAKAFRTVNEYHKLLEDWQKAYSPKSEDMPPHPLFIESLNNKDHVGYLLDILTYGTDDEKRDLREEVNRIEQRLQEYHAGGASRMAG